MNEMHPKSERSPTPDMRDAALLLHDSVVAIVPQLKANANRMFSIDLSQYIEDEPAMVEFFERFPLLDFLHYMTRETSVVVVEVSPSWRLNAGGVVLELAITTGVPKPTPPNDDGIA